MQFGSVMYSEIRYTKRHVRYDISIFKNHLKLNFSDKIHVPKKYDELKNSPEMLYNIINLTTKDIFLQV